MKELFVKLNLLKSQRVQLPALDLRKSISLAAGSTLLFLFTTSCQTTEKVKVMDTPSYWVFKTKASNKEKNRTITGYSHITYANQNKVRIDLFGPLGLVHAGTVVYKDGQFQAVLPLERKYVYGQMNEDTMQALLKFPIDPTMFHNLIFQQGFENKDWQCVLDPASGRVRQCKNNRAGLGVDWTKDMDTTGGEFTVDHTKARAEFKFKKYRKLDSISDSKFQLDAPSGYKRFKADANGISKL